MAGAFRVEDLLAEFGKAIVSAQNTILKTAQENPAPLEGLRTAFSIGETELEVKLIFEETGALPTSDWSARARAACRTSIPASSPP